MTEIVGELPEGYRYITNGELQTFKECKRKWYLSNYRKLSPKKVRVSGPAPLGTRVHESLAAWYVPDELNPVDPLDQIDIDANRDRELVDSIKDYTEHEKKQLEDDITFARIMVEGYLEWLEETGEDVGLEIIAPEARVVADPKITDLNNVRLLAKLDVRARNTLDGSVVFVDHKTVKTFNDILLSGHMNEQILHYELIELLNLKDRGEDVTHRTDGAIFNMLRKVKRTATAKPPFYMRHHVRHNLETMRSYFKRLEMVIREIKMVEDMLDQGVDHRVVCYPTPNQMTCHWKCEFHKICHLFDDGSYVEDLISEKYVEINPLKRYESEEEGRTS